MIPLLMNSLPQADIVSAGGLESTACLTLMIIVTILLYIIIYYCNYTI